MCIGFQSYINFLQKNLSAAFFTAAKSSDDQLHQLHCFCKGEGFFTGAQPVDKHIHLLLEAVVGIAAADHRTGSIAQKGTYYQLYTGAFELE